MSEQDKNDTESPTAFDTTKAMYESLAENDGPVGVVAQKILNFLDRFDTGNHAGLTGAKNFMGKIEFQHYTARYMKDAVGTYDIAEGNRRLEQKQFWQYYNK